MRRIIMRKEEIKLNIVKVEMIIACFFMIFVSNTVFAEKYDLSYQAVYVNKRYDSKGRIIQLNSKNNQYYGYSLIVKNKSTGVKKVFNNAAPHVFTNGNKVYYCIKNKSGSNKVSIKCYQFNTGKNRTVTGGEIDDIFGINGKYIYYTKNVQASRGNKLIRYEIETGKTKCVTDVAAFKDEAVYNMKYGNKKYLIYDTSSDVSNLSIYIMNIDGTGIKKITTGLGAGIRNGKVYYYKIEDGSYSIYCCDFDGKNKKYLESFEGYYDIPEEYEFLYSSIA